MLASLACFVMASANFGFDTNHKKQNSINYVQNLDTGQAYWVSRDDTTDAWTAQFLGEDYQKGTLPDVAIPRSRSTLYKQAKSTDIMPPSFEIIADSSSDSVRHLTLNMNAHRGIAMQLRWKGAASITNVGLHDKTVSHVQNAQNYLYYFQDLTEDVTLNLSYLSTDEPPSLEFTFLDPGLPTELISNYKERPEDAMPPPFPVFMSDATIWQTTVDLDRIFDIR
jgi:hypothetical protein